MNLVIVGGNEKLKKDYINLAKEKGHKTKVYLNMSSKLNKSIGSPDALVIFTSVVSHKMIDVVQKHAKKKNIPIIRHKNSSKCAFLECLEMVDECLGNCNECKCNKLLKQNKT
ncbi:DUF2325 domain-containing protein [Romboutsia sp. 1001713B170131_170501_G6]|uniref:DUF2325 domain-containing protein n=1 Tax=Romboutsia sp. 1001713B170131_170501_G6 TaxID=2787108 RepID=UPI0018A8F122